MSILYQSDRVASVSIGEENSPGFKITDLRIAFEIKKTNKSDCNDAKITITNLSENSRSLIRKNDLVILKAGYSEAYGEEDLFIGYVKQVNNSYDTPNIHTILDCKDGIKKLEDSKISLSYDTGFSIKNIIQDVIKKLNLSSSIDIDKLNIPDVEFTNGLSFAGEISHLLDYLCQSAGLEWSFQNNKLKIQNKDEGDFTDVVVLSPSSGLIGSPERVEDVENSRSRAKTDVPGWKIKSLLQPKIEPGKIIQVFCNEINGAFFKVFSVEHNGDTHGKEWESIIKVAEAGAVVNDKIYNLNFNMSNSRLV